MNIRIVEMANYSDAESKYKGIDALVKKYKDSSLYGLTEELVKADIIRNKWYFDGDYHQNGEFGTYVFEDSDGDRYVWSASMRYFSEMMADIWNRIDKEDTYGELDFYIGVDSEVPLYHVPKSATEFRTKNNLDYETINCDKCGKPITKSEYCINFGTCRDCFDRDYEEYLKNKEKSGD